ncbi:hypothetical protein C8Q80DRAFT_580338 [Daedaleopsis nitida]|nr:hypothetical protein C8Q80DRAFT_580338 [Daedaleopsis nitida]
MSVFDGDCEYKAARAYRPSVTRPLIVNLWSCPVVFGKDKQDNDGLLGLPDLGLSDLFPTLGGPKTTSLTSSATSSVQTTTSPTISLTLTDGTSASTTALTTTQPTTAATTSATTGTTSDSASTTSETASSTSTTTSSSSEAATSTTASVTDTVPTTGTFPPSTATVTDTVPPTLPSSTDAPATTSAAAATAESFLENKPLSVGVITTASILGLILLVILATWAIRKRRKDRVYDDILDFSPNSNLVGRENDLEKGASATDVGSSVGHDGGSSMGHGTVPPPVQQRQMYQDNYAAPIYAPKPPPSRNANPYGVQPAYGAGAYNGGYQQNNAYDNWGYGYGNAAAPPIAYDQAYGGMDDAYGGMADTGMMAGVGAGAQPANPPQRRPSAHRKAPPPLNLSAANPIAQPVQVSPVAAGNNAPVQPAGAHSTLPDEFGAAGQEPRRLMVRNE